MITIKRALAVKLFEALFALSREKEGKALFKFEPKTTWNIVKNLRVLRTFVEDLEATRCKIIKEITPAAEIQQGTPEALLFAEKWDAFLADSETLEGILFIEENSLNLEKNDIPLSALAGLIPILRN